MNDSGESIPSPTLVLAAAVVAATASAGLSTALLPALLELLDVDTVAGVILLDALTPLLHALLPLGFVYAVCRRVGGCSLSTWTVAGVSLPAAVLGRYVGTGAGYALLGRPFPTPLVLVSPGDLAVKDFGGVLWAGVVLGVLGAGLWGAVGAVGAVDHAAGSE